MNRHLTALLAGGTLLLGAATAQAALPEEATLYKNPQCGCCDAYARHLETLGIAVTVVDDIELGEIKQAAGVPYGLGACHTVSLGDYWIEGHVPLAAVESLFEERPATAGIGLAGMPLGTPGMPGPQREPYEVYRFEDHQASPYLTL